MSLTPLPINLAESTEQAAPKIRLYISPLSQESIGNILPPLVLPSASNISFHQVQTFPERCFGYINLPNMEAEKLKKKLNGSILRGSKVRVEEALPEKRKQNHGDPIDRNVKKLKTSRSKKREEGVLSGHELSSDRRVKRGWTEPVRLRSGSKDDRKKARLTEKSKYSKGPELLFRAKVLPNRTIEAVADPPQEAREKRKKRQNFVTVHEFSKSTKQPRFLKEDSNPEKNALSSRFVDGIGWLDVDDNVLEADHGERHKETTEEATNPNVKSSPGLGTQERKSENEVTPLQSGSRLEDTSNSARKKRKKKDLSTKERESNAGIESPSTRNKNSNASPNAPAEMEDHKAEELHVINDSSSASLSGLKAGLSTEITKSGLAFSEPNPSPSLLPSSRRVSFVDLEPNDPKSQVSPNLNSKSHSTSFKDIHPLEALFKRSKPSPSKPPANVSEINTSFKFFEIEDGEDHAAVPPTPFTRKDLSDRRVRSPAPAPDTAGLGPRGRMPWEGDDEAEGARAEDVLGAENAESSGNAAGFAEEQKPESEFAKWFWEHRGDLNRSWKRRRREAMKAERQRENKRLNRRIV